MGYQAELAGDIRFRFIMKIGDDAMKNKFRNYVLLKSQSGREKKFYLSDVEMDTVDMDGEQCYFFTYEVAAKDLTDKITAQYVSADGEKGTAYTMSVRDYLNYILAKADAESGKKNNYRKAVPIVKALLNYGATAQTYFDCRTEDLANQNLSSEDKDLSRATVEALEPYNVKKVEKADSFDEKFSYIGTSLFLKSTFGLRMYVKMPEGSDGYGVYAADAAGNKLSLLPYHHSYDRCYIDFSDIPAKKLDDQFQVKLWDTENRDNSETITTSPLSYAYQVLTESKDENLKDLMRGMFLYYQAAKEYDVG